MKARIIKRTLPSGRVRYVIQQKHFLFRWWWVDAWVNSINPYVNYEFDSLESAHENMCWFDDTKIKEEVIQ